MNSDDHLNQLLALRAEGIATGEAELCRTVRLTQGEVDSLYLRRAKRLITLFPTLDNPHTDDEQRAFSALHRQCQDLEPHVSTVVRGEVDAEIVRALRAEGDETFPDPDQPTN